jgi:flagellar hook-basal body complex protein FliE
MSVATNAIGAIAGAAASAASSATTSSIGGASVFSAGETASASAAPFADLIADAVGDVSRLENQANAAVSGLMTGAGVDVHQAMIATQKADMAFELALAVRNKAVQAYQSVMGMQF